MNTPTDIESAADFLARLFLEAKHCYAPECGGEECLPLVLERDAAIRAEARREALEEARKTLAKVDIVFDGPPGHESGRFVECEVDGRGVNIGEWEQRGAYWVLRPTRALDALATESPNNDR